MVVAAGEGLFTGRQMFSDKSFAAVTDRRTVPASGTDPYTPANRHGGVHHVLRKRGVC